MALKRKRVVLKLQDKLNLLEKLESGVSVSLLSTEYGIARQTISDLKRKKDEIRAYVGSEVHPKSKRKTMQTGKHVKLEKAILKWIHQEDFAGVTVRTTEIKSAAERLAAQMQLSNFAASNGWLYKFQHRHGIFKRRQPSTSSAVAEPVTAISTGDASGDEDGPDPLVDDSSEPPVQKVVDTTPDTLHASPIKDDRETDPLNVSPRQDGGKVVPQRKSQIKASAKNQLDKEPQNSCSYKSRIGVERKQKTVDSFFSPRICETAENELFLPQSSETKVPEAHHSEHDNNSSIQTKKRRLDTQEIVDDIPPKSEPVGVEQGNFEALGKYLAMQLKQLPLKNAISLQMEIHNLLAKEQCKVLEEKTAATETVTCNEMGLNHSAVNSRPTEIQNTLGEQVLNNNAVNSGMLRTVSSSSQQPSNSLTPTKSNNSIEKDTSTDTTGAITPLKATNAKKRKRGGNHIERVLDTPLDAKSAKETVKVEEAEFEAFGKFIATQLKQHPIKSAINLQIEIHNLIGKELVKCLQEQNSMAPSVDILAPDPGGDDWDVVSIKSEAESISSFEQQ